MALGQNIPAGAVEAWSDSALANTHDGGHAWSAPCNDTSP
jgi:hypothetical protein